MYFTLLFCKHLATSLTLTHPALKQWQQALPSHCPAFTRSKPSQMTCGSKRHPLPHTPSFLFPAWALFSPPSQVELSSAWNTLPSPQPLVNLGTPTPAGRLFPNVTSSVEASPPLPGARMPPRISLMCRNSLAMCWSPRKRPGRPSRARLVSYFSSKPVLQPDIIHCISSKVLINCCSPSPRMEIPWGQGLCLVHCSSSVPKTVPDTW